MKFLVEIKLGFSMPMFHMKIYVKQPSPDDTYKYKHHQGYGRLASHHIIEAIIKIRIRFAHNYSISDKGWNEVSEVRKLIR